jgi:hypothetical protein
MVYSLLAIAESLGASASTSPPPQQLGESPPRRPGDTDKDLLTAQDVAHMTGLSVHTLSWWRFNGGPGPKYLKLGRRIFAARPRDGVSGCLDGLFSAHVGDRGWLGPLPYEANPRG